MLKFVTKEEYWDALDQGVDEMLGVSDMDWQLKNIQDVALASYVMNEKGFKIAEIGGGNSRLLPMLAKNNKVYNIDRFDGTNNGPVGEPELDGVQTINCFIGDSKGVIDSASFDLVFSISVVEHISIDDLPDFMADCHRILKPGGKMYHAIDVYLTEEDFMHDERPWFRRALGRVKFYLSLFEGKFEPLEKPRVKFRDQLRFKPIYATNPDNIMYEWNRRQPLLKEVRKNAQLVTLLFGARKVV